jgi:peroxiredoxin
MSYALLGKLDKLLELSSEIEEDRKKITELESCKIAALALSMLRDPKSKKEYDTIVAKLKKDFPESLEYKLLLKEADFIGHTSVGTTPWNISGSSVTDKKIDLSKFKGKVVLIDFWVSWAPPCLTELTYIQKALKDHSAKGFRAIGITGPINGDSKEKIKAIMELNKLSFENIWDLKNITQARWRIRSIPSNYLIGRDGKIIAKNIHGEDLLKAIKRAVKTDEKTTKEKPSKKENPKTPKKLETKTPTKTENKKDW